jgi:hypothetical protein
VLRKQGPATFNPSAKPVGETLLGKMRDNGAYDCSPSFRRDALMQQTVGIDGNLSFQE